jgi:hypothetical protein
MKNKRKKRAVPKHEALASEIVTIMRTGHVTHFVVVIPTDDSRHFTASNHQWLTETLPYDALLFTGYLDLKVEYASGFSLRRGKSQYHLYSEAVYSISH